MTLSAALFKRLYQAIEEDRKSDAVLFLTQVFDHQNSPEHERHRAFLSGLRTLGDEFNAAGDHIEAERHYCLALELFDKFFNEDVREGLALNRRLCELYERTGEAERLQVQMDRAYDLVRRMLSDVSEVAMVDDVQRTGTGSQSHSTAFADPQQSDSSAKALKVLLIEDNPDDAGLVQDSLSDAGLPLSLDWAETLEEGLARLQEKPVDVVLLDLALPDSQNVQTIRALKMDAPRVPIVVLTGNDDRELILEALRTGARDYLIKGRVDAQQLVGSLHSAVQSRISHQASEWESKLRLDTMRQILRHLDKPALVLNTKYGIVEANKKFCELVPSTEEHIRGMSFMELCPHFPRTEFDDLLVSGGRRRFPEFTVESRTGEATVVPAEVSTIVDSFHNVRWLVIRLG
jgi:CheY-like chemotaxis protein